MKGGVLFGIGVGPGAPDLLTLRAVEILGRVPVVLAARSTKNEDSLALACARPHLRPQVKLVYLDFPMTSDAQLRKIAWETAARTTLAILEQGLDAAFLTIGDPLIYSTFGYLMQTLKKLVPECEVVVIPGITSFQAAAARTLTVLCEDRERLHILPGILSSQDLVQELAPTASAVILKAYRNYSAIKDALAGCGRLSGSLLASRLEQKGEQIRAVEEVTDTPPYMSLVVSRPKSD